MKRFFILFVTTLVTCSFAMAHTINWHDVNQTTQTTCTVGDSIIPPTPIGKYGYHFKEWQKFTPIEYLESTGTQWIDTGVVPTINTKFELAGQQGVGDTAMFGLSIVLYAFSNQRGENHLHAAFFDDRSGSPFQPDLTSGKHSIIMSQSDGLLVDDVQLASYTTSRPVAVNYSIVLFCRRDNDNGELQKYGQHKIYYTKIYDYNTLVRDFIPVLDSTGTPCMYDKVGGQFYYNQGTGNFIAGPRLSE